MRHTDRGSAIKGRATLLTLEQEFEEKPVAAAGCFSVIIVFHTVPLSNLVPIKPAA